MLFHLPCSDDAPHSNMTAAINNITIYNLTMLLRDTFPETLILPSIGNHDSFPHNDVPVAPSVYYSNLLFNMSWSTMLPNASWETFLNGKYEIVEYSEAIYFSLFQ